MNKKNEKKNEKKIIINNIIIEKNYVLKNVRNY